MSQQSPSEYGAGGGAQPSWNGGDWPAQPPHSPYEQQYGQPYSQQPPASPGASSGWGGTANPWPAGGEAAPPPYGAPPPPNAPYPGYPDYPPTAPTYPGYGAPPSQGFPPGYGNAPYNPYGPYGAPPPPPRKNRVGMIIGIVVGVVLLACVGGVALLYALGNAVQSQIPAVSATLTASAQQSPATQGSPAPTVIYQDALNTSTSGWPNDNDCTLRADGLRVRNSVICYAPTDTLTNIDVKVQVQLASGSTSDPFGIVMRRTSKGNYYQFVIDRGGETAVAKCVSSQPDCSTLADFATNSAVHTGLNATNTLEVKAVNSHFEFDVNGQMVDQVDDSTFASGLVGLGVLDSVTAIYSNLTITSAS